MRIAVLVDKVKRKCLCRGTGPLCVPQHAVLPKPRLAWALAIPF